MLKADTPEKDGGGRDLPFPGKAVTRNNKPQHDMCQVVSGKRLAGGRYRKTNLRREKPSRRQSCPKRKRDVPYVLVLSVHTVVDDD